MSNYESTFQCPSCRSTESRELGNYVQCLHCGNRYRKKIQNEPIYPQLVYAVNERQEADFDKARRRYDEIIEKHTSESGMEEAYWGRFLCEQYVIFYHNEAGEAIPSFWRVNDEPCKDSPSYKKAIEYARFSGNMENYEKQADLIEEYKKKYRGVKKQYPEGSQIFICFKDSGTDDANLGYKIYNKFSGKYNIFFSKESLNTMKGNDYEPYIYHALTMAKAMIVICSSRDNLDSKWVHNEWWRFFSFSKSSEKTIIPIFRENFNASQLPEDLSHCEVHKEDVDLLSVLSERLDAILKNETDVPLTSFEREWNTVNTMFETEQVDDAKIQVRELLADSMERPHDHISALLLHAKIYSNNYKHLKNEHAAASIAHAQELAKTHDIAIEDISEYKRYQAAVAKKRVKKGLIAFLIAAFLGAGAFFAWHLMQDTSVKNLSNSKYHATIDAETGRFELGTEFQVAEIQADNQTKSAIRQLPINQSTYHLYEMELWRYGSEVEVEGNVTVTIPLPSGISADRAVVYYMSGDTPEQIPATVSKGNISFTTNHFSVYMIAEEKDGCDHIAVIDRAVAPTCTEEGLTEGQHCSLCKETLVVQETVPAKGHTPGQAANCIEGQHCTVCHVELVTALGHKPAAAATCIDAQKCMRCLVELVPAKGHSPRAATCTDAKICTVCHIEMAPAKGHTPGPSATCTDAQECLVCNTELIPAKGHTSGQAATCTSAQYCTVCNTELKPAKGHSPSAEPTCTVAQSCTVCHIELTPAKGHKRPATASCTEEAACVACGIILASGDGHQPSEPATCTKGQYCTVCNIELVPANGHKRPEGTSCLSNYACTVCGEQIKAEKSHSPGDPSTCTTAQYCTVCNTELRPANGHKPGADATCTSGQICTVCNIELVPAKEHRPGVEPNCLNGQYCTVCRTQLKPPVDHIPGTPPTCTEKQFCTVCNIELASELGHLPGSEATCENAQLCLICGFELTPMKEHQVENWVIDKNSINGPLGVKRGNCSSCRKLVEVSILFSDGLSYSKNSDGTYTVTGIGTYTDEKLIIPPVYEGASVVAIKDYAFRNCTSIVSVEIPSSVETIGIFAFLGCSNLSTLTLNEGLETINYGAFYKCPITSLVIPDSVTSMPVPYSAIYEGSYYHGAFESCSALKSVTIGSGLLTIEKETFKACTTLESIIINNGVQTISEYAFVDCSSLASVEIPASVEIIGEYAFSGCTLLEHVTIGTGVQKIGSYAFNECSGLISVNIGPNVQIIDSHAFRKCASLISVEIPASVQTIGIGAFIDCNMLSTLILNEGLKTIQNRAFYKCPITTLVIPDSVTSIESPYSNYWEESYYHGAFEGCTELKSITIGNGLLTIERETFKGCSSLETLILGDDVQTIGEYAFLDCSSLTKIEIPGSVKSIGLYAFKGCNKLETLILNEGLQTIYGGAFMGCPIVSLVIPDSVTTIKSYSYDSPTIYDGAFEDCTKLTSVTFGKGISYLESEIFNNCTALSTMISTGTKAQWYAINWQPNWRKGTPATKVTCSDGQIIFI